MWIERIEIDAFGKLQDYRLELGKGLQVLYGQNEQGKTTLMTFLKLMFYGKQPRLQGLDNPRKRYAPWNGQRMGGAVEFISGGVRYRLQKEFGDTPGRDKVKLMRADSGELIPLGKDEEVGQRFLGLDLAGFERSSFIGRTGCIDAGKSDTVAEKLLANFIESGDESIPAQEVIDRLIAAKYDLVSRSGGKGQLAEARQRMQALRDVLAVTEAQIRDQQGLTERCRILEQAVQQEKTLDEKWQGALAWQRAQRLDALLTKAQQLAGQIEELERPGLTRAEVEQLLSGAECAAEEYRLAVRSLNDFCTGGDLTETKDILEESAVQQICACADKLDTLERLIAKMEQELFPAAAELNEKREAAAQAQQMLAQTEAAAAAIQPQRNALNEQHEQRYRLANRLDTLRNEREKQQNAARQEQAQIRQQCTQAEQMFVLYAQQRKPNKIWLGAAAALAVMLVALTAILNQPLILSGFILVGALLFFGSRTPKPGAEEASAHKAYIDAAAKLDIMRTHAQEQESVLTAEIEQVRDELEQTEQRIARQMQSQAAWTALDEQLEQHKYAAQESALFCTVAEQAYRRVLAAVLPMSEPAGVHMESLVAGAVQPTICKLVAERERRVASLNEQLAYYRCATVDELQKKLLVQRANVRSRTAMQELEKTVQQSGETLLAQVSRYQTVSSPEQAAALTEQLRAAVESIIRLETEVRGAAAGLGLHDIRPDALMAERTALQTAMRTYDPQTDPDPDVLHEQLICAKQSNAAQQLLALQKRLRTPERTPAEIRPEMDVLAEDITQMERYSAAVDLALEVMTESMEEMRSSFGPALNQATGEILAALTGGRYEQVLVSRDYGVNVKAGTHYREHSYFSSGTVDQVYLALRLAMSQLIGQGQEPLPLLLDDVLMQYDDDRAAMCIDYLAQCAERGVQIMLFTCHAHIAALAQSTGVSAVPLCRE